MKTSTQGIRALMKSEKFEPIAYKDSVGVWTVGYGTIKLDGKPVVSGQRITQERAEQELVKFCGGIETFLDTVLGKAPTTQTEFDAFVNILYNIGIHHKDLPTFLKRHIEGDKKGCAEAISWWNKAGGQTLKGLVNRRTREANLYLNGVYSL